MQLQSLRCITAIGGGHVLHVICDLLFFILVYDCVLRSAPTTPPYCGFCSAVCSERCEVDGLD